MEAILVHCHPYCVPTRMYSSCKYNNACKRYIVESRMRSMRRKPILLTRTSDKRRVLTRVGASPGGVPLDLTEENVRQVLDDARVELGQLFDKSVGMTGEAELAELDGPFVKIRLRGRFWHERSLVLARLGNYLKQRIPEILEVDIEDQKQLDDSTANF